MRVATVLAMALVAGCGISEEKYQQRYAESYCEWALQCLDAPVLEFYGWEDLETCVPDFGGRQGVITEACIYDPKAARTCLKDMKNYGCESAPDVPESCELAYLCGDGTEDSGL